MEGAKTVQKGNRVIADMSKSRKFNVGLGGEGKGNGRMGRKKP